MSVVVKFKTLPKKRGTEKATLAELLIRYNIQTKVEAQKKIIVSADSAWTRLKFRFVLKILNSTSYYYIWLLKNDKL